MYVCCRSMKVQKGIDSQGKPIMEMRQPGDDIPEAANWPNPGTWVNRGFIRLKDGRNHIPGYDRGKLQPARESTDADTERATAQVPTAGEPLPGYQGQGSGDAGNDTSGGTGGGTDLILTEDELLGMKNDDLRELGETFDLQLKGAKAEMVEAILEAQAAAG